MKKLLATVTAGLLAVCAVGCFAGCGAQAGTESKSEGSWLDNSIYNKQIKDVKFFRGKAKFLGIKIIHSNAGLQAFLEEEPFLAEELSDYTIAEGESIVAFSTWRSTSSEKDFTVSNLIAFPPQEDDRTPGLDFRITIEYKFSGFGTCDMSSIALFAKTEALAEYQECFISYRNVLGYEKYEELDYYELRGHMAKVENIP